MRGNVNAIVPTNNTKKNSDSLISVMKSMPANISNLFGALPSRAAEKEIF